MPDCQCQEFYIIVALDRFSKLLSAKVHTSTSNEFIIHFVEDYMYNHGLP